MAPSPSKGDVSSFLAFLGNNAFQVEASEAEAAVREKYPLLLDESETIEFAFKGRGGLGRDKSYLTSHRILIKDGKGIGSKRKNYQTIWYKHIQAFAIETAGALDGDVELHVYSTGGTCAIDFATGKVDIFAIQQFLNTKINFSTDGAEAISQTDRVENVPVSIQQQGEFGKLIDWLGNNASQLDPGPVQTHLTTVTPVLLKNETVELAFKAGRDTTVFTDKRLMIIDVKGLLGQKVEFLTLKWSSLSGFAVQTAGQYLDRDTEVMLYTKLVTRGLIMQDFRKSGADIMLVQRYLTNRLLSNDTTTEALPNIDRKPGHVDDAKGSWWFRDNQRPLDAAEMERYYKTQVPILHSTETVEFAFKGRRDITLFTTKRLLDIDPKGWKGVKVQYTTIPWKSVLGFGVKTAGKHFDRDAEVRIWTDMFFIPGSGDDNPPQPGMSFLELDFNKDIVDVLVLQKYLSERLLSQQGANATPIPRSTYVSPPEKGLEKLMSKIGSDHRAIDASMINAELHSAVPILLASESVVMAFKAGRDMIVFTNLRVIEMDVQGWSGAKVAYTSLPYGSIRAFSAESAGSFDLDSEVDLYTRNLWDLSKVGLDFRKGKADIIQIQKFLSGVILGNEEEKKSYMTNTLSYVADTNTAGVKSMLSFLTDNAKQVDNDEVNTRLHSDPPILLESETVEFAFRKARDLYVFTTHRALKVDVKGILGKKVEYQSIPWTWCHGFEIETAGHLDWDAEVYLLNDIASMPRQEVSIWVESFDIMKMQKYMSKKLGFGFGELS